MTAPRTVPKVVVTRLARVGAATTSTVMADVQTAHRPASTPNIFGGSRGSAILGASNYLRLVAAPTFTVMALLTGVVGSPKDPLCSVAHDVSPLSGMAAMYLLMSIFHSPPWLKLISGRRKERPRGGVAHEAKRPFASMRPER
jgi:hypothetical protein